MIFRNGFKEYALMGIFYGLSMGIFFGVTSENAIGGIISGVICGILFAFFMYLFIHKQEKKFDIKREEISKERKIFCDGGATLNGVGVWLFFTTQWLEFYPHKVNFSRKEIMIPLIEIKIIGSASNCLTIQNGKGDVFIFRVSHRKEWAEVIQSKTQGA